MPRHQSSNSSWCQRDQATWRDMREINDRGNDVRCDEVIHSLKICHLTHNLCILKVKNWQTNTTFSFLFTGLTEVCVKIPLHTSINTSTPWNETHSLCELCDPTLRDEDERMDDDDHNQDCLIESCLRVMHFMRQILGSVQEPFV